MDGVQATGKITVLESGGNKCGLQDAGRSEGPPKLAKERLRMGQLEAFKGFHQRNGLMVSAF